jgi:hypothetical protein
MTIIILLAAALLATAAFFIRRRRRPAVPAGGGAPSPPPSAALAAVEHRRRALRALLPQAALGAKAWSAADLPLLQQIAQTHLRVEQHSRISFNDDGEMQVEPSFKVFNVDLAYALGEALGEICRQKLPSLRWKVAADGAALPFDVEQNPVYLVHDRWEIGLPIYGAVVRAVMRGQPVDLQAIVDTMVDRTRTLLAEQELMAAHPVEDTAPAALFAEVAPEAKKEGRGAP